MNILIVDDHLINLKLLRAQLEFEGHAVFDAHDGVDALALLQQECQRVDLVISDILMPRMDGYRLCHEIRKHVRLHDLPVIIYTSTYTSPGDEQLALDVGANKYLTKPAPVEMIVAALQEVIAQSHVEPRGAGLGEVEVLKVYSEQLANKLEEKSRDLQTTHEELRQLLTHSPSVLYRIRIEGQRIILDILSENMEWLIGVKRMGIHFEWWKENMHPEDRERAMTVLSQGLKGDGYLMDYRIRHEDGTYRWIEDNSRVVRDVYGQSKEMVGVWTDITDRRQAERELEASRAQLRGYLARREVASEEERKYIAREVHDELGQVLTGLQLNVSVITHKFAADAPALREYLQETMMLTNRALDAVRNVTSALRPAALEMGIVSALEWLAGRFGANQGIQCVVHVADAEIQFGENHAIALYRIVQESLTNVARHAGAGNVEISLTRERDDYVLKVRDNGAGFDASVKKENSFGLVGIRERALMLAGTVSINTHPGGGTEVVVRIPINKESRKL